MRRSWAAPRVALVDVPPDAWAPDPDAERRVLRLVCAEAVVLQDDAQAVVLGVRSRAPLATLARRGGPLARRFFALRDRLPAGCADPELDRLRGAMAAILHSHAMVLTTALELAACEWRSERLARQVDALDGLGAPAAWLDDIYATLAAPADDDAPAVVVDGAPQR